MSKNEITQIIKEMGLSFSGKSYNILTKVIPPPFQNLNLFLFEKNCNHFCDELLKKICDKQLPSWINRLAKIGNIA